MTDLLISLINANVALQFVLFASVVLIVLV